jgi:hypothetical protein
MLPIALVCPFLITPFEEQSKMDKPEQLAT